VFWFSLSPFQNAGSGNLPIFLLTKIHIIMQKSGQFFDVITSTTIESLILATANFTNVPTEQSILDLRFEIFP
jgi:hypothetical protein